MNYVRTSSGGMMAITYKASGVIPMKKQVTTVRKKQKVDKLLKVTAK